MRPVFWAEEMRCVAIVAVLAVCLSQPVAAFVPSAVPLRSSPAVASARQPAVSVSMQEAAMDTSARLYDPVARDAHYNGNIAQHLVDLHDASATFDFCGGMMFQLVLSDKLRTELAQVASQGAGHGHQPVIHDASTFRMANVPGYTQTADVDNVKLFHGREVRQVPTAAGGMGMVLQLVSTEGDPEAWTQQEVAGYDGWGHDSGRQWRTGAMLEGEGYAEFRKKFGDKAFTLHHRFYLHLDGRDRMWLSAEDGCEGARLLQGVAIVAFVHVGRETIAAAQDMFGQIKKLLG